MKSGPILLVAFNRATKLQVEEEPSNLVGSCCLTLAFAADELFDAAIGFVVGHLHRWMLGEKSRRGMQYAADSAIQGKFAAADGVDGHAG